MRRTDWFESARFGMFIHWGLYSGPAGIWQGQKIRHPYAEWLQASERIPREEYRALAKVFRPRAFDAEAWVLEAKGAGMDYLVVTAKHHDGFALWPSRASTFNVVDATPFGRDVIGELAAACELHGLKLGLYYSHWQDWDGTGGDICTVNMEGGEYAHPTQEAFEAYWQGKCLPQVRELLEAYRPALMWFDSWHDYQGKGRDFTSAYLTDRRQEELIDVVRGASSPCLVNSRIHFTAPSPRVDLLSMMDNVYPETGFDRPWETSGTLNESWAYHALDFAWKPTGQLLRNLVGNAALGGNLQLNVGPTADGEFQPAAIRRLREIGAWMAVNGESIRGTRAGSVGAQRWGRVTQRELPGGRRRHYLHLFDFAPGGAVVVEGLRLARARGCVLETGQPVEVVAGGTGLWVATPAELAGSDLPVIAVDAG